ncbi:MAG: hypothetical protein WC254_03490 [Candidatus Woesearchaeota archaeon]|jgi:hypothetical protein
MISVKSLFFTVLFSACTTEKPPVVEHPPVEIPKSPAVIVRNPISLDMVVDNYQIKVGGKKYPLYSSDNKRVSVFRTNKILPGDKETYSNSASSQQIYLWNGSELFNITPPSELPVKNIYVKLAPDGSRVAIGVVKTDTYNSEYSGGLTIMDLYRVENCGYDLRLKLVDDSLNADPRFFTEKQITDLFSFVVDSSDPLSQQRVQWNRNEGCKVSKDPSRNSECLHSTDLEGYTRSYALKSDGSERVEKVYFTDLTDICCE